ncbi:hypothetical protein GOV04_01880 [Candidatus Woesearchaeota archaeon]|nr:hypothetical protein [Candidatus Woesearchaeota archaeon]
MIKHVSLKHGWFYHYRVHEQKTKDLINGQHAKLKNYLYDMFTDCPDDKFQDGPRSSSLQMPITVNLQEHDNHEVSQLAAQGLENNSHYKTAHSKVQMFMLGYDHKTISVELPIWLEQHEHPKYSNIFNTTKPLTGHIDILRVEDKNKIWVWDYKPKAKKEKKAVTQTYFYALMLAKRTGLTLNQIMCGYFDEHNTYTFSPKNAILQ